MPCTLLWQILHTEKLFGHTSLRPQIGDCCDAYAHTIGATGSWSEYIIVFQLNDEYTKQKCYHGTFIIIIMNILFQYNFFPPPFFSQFLYSVHERKIKQFVCP